MAKPTKLNTRVLPSGALRLNMPSELVLVPTVVPRTSTVTPGRPAPSGPVTRPLTGTSAAFAGPASVGTINAHDLAWTGLAIVWRLPAVSNTALRSKYL